MTKEKLYDYRKEGVDFDGEKLEDKIKKIKEETDQEIEENRVAEQRLREKYKDEKPEIREKYIEIASEAKNQHFAIPFCKRRSRAQTMSCFQNICIKF